MGELLLYNFCVRHDFVIENGLMSIWNAIIRTPYSVFRVNMPPPFQSSAGILHTGGMRRGRVVKGSSWATAKSSIVELVLLTDSIQYREDKLPT